MGSAQTWTAPAVPGTDLTTLSSETYVYVYNVEANAVVSYGMDWGTNGCAVRLTNGESAASIPQRCYAFVDGTKVSIRMVDYGEKYVSCLSEGVNNVYVDQDTNREFTFTETASGSHVYTLTNVTYNLPLDVYWDRGGHLTLASGQGHTKWAFITENDLTAGKLSLYRMRVQLYNVWKAISDAGKTATYSSQIATAATTYNNSNATAAALQAAASTLFRAAAADLSGTLDVSFLFDGADMCGAASCSAWGADKGIAWGEFEQYHSSITLTQTQSVPQGIYDVAFRALFRQDGSDAAPTLTAVADNTITAEVPDLSTLDFSVGNASNNGYTSGENYVQPNNMKSAGESMLGPESQALAHNVAVGSGGSLAVTASMTSANQWLNWQGIEVYYRGTSTMPLKEELSAVITTAEGVYNASYKGASDLLTVLNNARSVYSNSSATAVTINNARLALLEAIDTYLYVSATVDHPLDYTDHLKNPSFENGLNHWVNNGMQTQTNTAFTGKDGDTYVEKWTGAGNAVGDGSVLQTMSGLEMGKFVLKAQAQNIQEGSTATQSNAWIVGNLDKTAVSANGEYTLVWTNIEDNATVGFLAEGATGNWIGVDNFRLYYAGGELSDFQTELQNYITYAQSVQGNKMEASVRSVLETAISNGQTELTKSTATGYPSVAKALREAKEAADVSTRAFQALQDAITLAEQRYGSGNMTGADQFLTAINQAKAVNNNLNSTQSQMSDEIANLEKAYRRYRVTNGTGTAPTVVTDSRYARGCIEAFGRMTVSGVSDSDILEQGFCYSSTNSEPTVLDQCGTDYLECNGRIYRMSMEPATIYYIRAYCMTTNYAVGYGDIIKMCTLPMGNVTYTYYNNDGGEFHNNKNTNALSEACYYWSRYTSINGFHVTANYASGTPTADCGYGGGMRIGSNTGQRTGTMMHEMNHGIGGGTIDVWNSDWLRTGDKRDWAGERANGVLNFWENRSDLVITRAYDDAHWGFRAGNDSYSNENMWYNKYAFNGSHLEAGNWAGPSNWNDTQICYIGNSLLQQGMCEDGLVPVNYWSGGFCLPAYVLVSDDNQKYYIKNESTERGLLTSYLVENTDGTLSWADHTGDDRSAWYVGFNPATQYYQFRNALTGHYINFNDGGTNGFKANGTTGTSDTEQFHLIRGRTDVKVDGSTFGEGMRGYWLMRINDGGAPRALTADAGGSTSANSVNRYDDATTQRWVFVAANEMEDFEQDVINVNLEGLRQLIAGFKAAKNVSHTDKTTGATTALTNTISSIESAISGTVTLEQVNQYINDMMVAGKSFLNNTLPSGTVPYDLTFLLKNPDLNNTTEGWSLDPTRNYGAVEFYQTNFDFYQTLTDMPAGTYQLTANAFQCPGSKEDVYTAYSGGTDNMNARLYINSLSQNIKNIAAEAQATSQGGSEYETAAGTFFPDNLEAGSKYFTQNIYSNSLQGDATAGDLRIGLRGTTGTGYWVMADNFHLYYWGLNGTVLSLKEQLEANGFTKITSLPADYSPYFFVLYDHDQDLTMVPKIGVHQGNAYKGMWYDADLNPMTSREPLWTLDAYEQDNTTYQIVANVTIPDYMFQTEYNAAYHYRTHDNGGGGTGWGRTLYAYDSTNGYWTIQNGVYPNDGYLGPWEGTISDDAETALNKTGATQGHFDVFTILRGDWVKRFDAWGDAAYESPLDITYVLENPGGERRTTIGWKNTGASWQGQGNSPSGKVGGYYLEHWNGNGVGDSDLYQEVSGLPDGYYRFSARALVRDGGDQGFSLYANSESTKVTAPDLNTRFNVIVQVLDGTLRVGAKAENVTKDWIAIDEAKLEYLGLEIPGYNVGTPTSDIADGSYIQSLEAWTLNFTEAASNVEGAVFAKLDNDAKISLYKNGTKVGDYVTYISGTTVSANFTGLTLETGAEYRLDFPAGAVGYAGQVSNEAVSVSFHTPVVFDGTYYLYNTYTQNYLSRGGTWATACILDDWGLAMLVATNSEGKTTLKYFDSQAYLFKDGSNGYCWGDGGTGAQFTVSKTGTNYKFLNEGIGYLAVYDGRAVTDAIEGNNLVGTSNVWTLESTADHVANYTACADAQAATAASAASISGITTKAALDTYLATNTGTVDVTITGEKAERYNWYAAQAETLAESEYYKETVEGLTPGLYRLSVDAFQRAGGFDDVAAADGARGCIYLYANDAKTQVKSVMEYGSTTSYADTDYQSGGLYYPNRENPGYAALETGNYQNVVYVYVTDGTLTFGINNPNRMGNGISRGVWSVFENFRLERVVSGITLDQESTTAPPRATHVDVTFNRTIISNSVHTATVNTENAWNTICFPFSLTETQMKAAFGNNVVVKKLSGLTVNGESASLRFEQVDAIEANKPYILQIRDAGYAKSVYTFENLDVTPSADLTDGETDGIQFVGTDHKITLEEGDFYILNDKFKKSLGGTKATKIKGFRAYFKLTGNSIKSLGFDEGEATGIYGNADVSSAPFTADGDVRAPVYDLSGRRVARPSKGFYVVNGKKVFVR